MLQHICSDQIVKNSLKKLNSQIVAVLNEVLEKFATLQNNKTFKLSLGEEFERMWVSFKAEMVVNLSLMDYKYRIVNCIETYSPISLKQSILTNKHKIISHFEKMLLIRLYRSMDSYTEEELNEIEKSLRSASFFNLTRGTINQELIDNLKFGKKFTPKTRYSSNIEMNKFNREIVSVLKPFLKSEFNVNLEISSSNIVQSLYEALNANQSIIFKQFINTAIKAYKKGSNMFRKYMKQNWKKTMNLPSENFYETAFNIDNDKILIEGDKNVGYVCMFIEDLKKQYNKINEQQHFGKVEIKEDWYIRNILDFIKQAELNLPTELSKIITKSNFKWEEKRPEIGVLRLQPKILKLKEINYANVSSLTSRGIKSSMKDPIKVVQQILDKYSKWSPSVCGIDEAISRIKESKIGNWGQSVEIEGDFTDLYSNCNKDLLISSVNRACKLATLSENSMNYIQILIECIMNHSYFKEPEGMFKTLKGFSMGDCSAARGSEIILRIAELDIFKILSRKKLSNNVIRYLRFRDDVSVHITGNKEQICETIKVICNGYPKEIIFNMETKIIQGKFLNIKVINFPTKLNPYTTILRKKTCKYNITPPNSNVAWKFKKLAGYGYFRTVHTHCTDIRELKNQCKIVRHILSLKGFSKSQISKIENQRKKDKNMLNSKRKKFLTTIKFNECSNRHYFVKKFVKESSINLETYYVPMDIPDKKLEQYIFTVKKMRKTLNF